MTLFSRPKPPPLQTLKPTMPWSAITLAEWQGSGARTDYAAALLKDPTFREMLSVVRNSLVVRDPTRFPNTNAERELGRALGVQDTLTLFLSLGTPMQAPVDVPQEYPNESQPE